MIGSGPQKLIRILFLAISVFIGVSVGIGVESSVKTALIGAVLGFLFAILVFVVDLSLRDVTIKRFSFGTVGLLIGLLCAFHLEQPSGWPEYGSVLKLELLQKVDLNSNEKEEVVRFYLNGELLRSMWHGHLREEISLKKLAHYVATVGAVKA